jgi:hypothetical protein
MKRLFPSAIAVCAAQAFAAAAPLSEVDLAALEHRYLACDRSASVQRLAPGDAAECAWTGDQLLRHRFSGDFDRLLQWWHSARDRSEPQRTPFEAAQDHYEAGRYAQAYALFAQLADCGHREAARIALQMRRFGPALYGMAFEASPTRLARWQGTLSADASAGPGSCTAA